MLTKKEKNKQINKIFLGQQFLRCDENRESLGLKFEVKKKNKRELSNVLYFIFFFFYRTDAYLLSFKFVKNVPRLAVLYFLFFFFIHSD